MTIAIFLGALIAAIALGIPIAYSLLLSGVALMWHMDMFDAQIMAQNVLEGANSFPLLAVPFFMLAGEIMNVGGLSRRIVNLALSLVGHVQGGLGFVTILAAVMMASLSGSAVADTAALAALLLPMMAKAGHDKARAGGLIASAGIIAPIIPPSIPMIIYAMISGTSVGALFMGGVVPGVILGLVMMIYTGFISMKRNYPVGKVFSAREFLRQAFISFPALLTVLILLAAIYTGFVTPTEAAVVAVLYSFAVGLMIHRSIGLQEIKDVLYNTTRLASISLFCIGTASAFGWVMAYYQLPKLVVTTLAQYGVGITSVGFIEAAAFLFIGCFIDAVPAIIIIAPLLAPLAQSVGMHPVHFGIIGVISLAFGLVTPPYGLCLLIDCHIAGVKVSDVLKDVFLILLPMLTALVLVILFPQLVLFVPKLLMPKFV
jgi:tripartite ATP-independent transporter DctM subunit